MEVEILKRVEMQMGTYVFAAGHTYRSYEFSALLLRSFASEILQNAHTPS